mmetsp:Transcript_33646/g.51908  ORF Transcript_33646/g.51908 Transcript_33646/m.51908 type:complete len:207 (-) Transcript_33646:1638-2258(-)
MVGMMHVVVLVVFRLLVIYFERWILLVLLLKHLAHTAEQFLFILLELFFLGQVFVQLREDISFRFVFLKGLLVMIGGLLLRDWRVGQLYMISINEQLLLIGLFDLVLQRRQHVVRVSILFFVAVLVIRIQSVGLLVIERVEVVNGFIQFLAVEFFVVRVSSGLSTRAARFGLVIKDFLLRVFSAPNSCSISESLSALRSDHVSLIL